MNLILILFLKINNKGEPFIIIPPKLEYPSYSYTLMLIKLYLRTKCVKIYKAKLNVKCI